MARYRLLDKARPFGPLLGLVAAMLLAPGAGAHEIRPAIAELAVDGEGGWAVTVTLNLEAMIAGISPEHEDTSQSANAARYDRLRLLPPEELKREFEGFAGRFVEGTALRADGERLAPEVRDLAVPQVGDTALARISTLVLGGGLPVGTASLTWSWDAVFGPVIIATRGAPAQDGPRGEIAYSALLLDGQESAPIPVVGAPAQTALEVFAQYIAVGFRHIVPEGLDHILFVVGLFLLSTRLRSLVIQVTSFTVAHTITLALGALGVVHIPPSIVEPLIALSIVYVAVENIVSDRLQRWRPAVVFGFGLLHGLGFAGVLAEVGLQPAHFISGLVAFNLGVELGQLTVIAGCFAVVGLWFANKPYYRAAITIPASIAIAVVAAGWFVERVVG